MRQVGVVAADLTELYDKYAPAIYRYCARRVGAQLAEDLVAEVFLVVVRRADRVGDDPLPWLYGIATNLLRTHRRAEVRAYRALARTGSDPLTAAEGHEGRSAERADASRASRRLAAALASLPRRQRDVLLLHAVGELTYAEIASALAIPIGSVQSALHRARLKMRGALDTSEVSHD